MVQWLVICLTDIVHQNNLTGSNPVRAGIYKGDKMSIEKLEEIRESFFSDINSDPSNKYYLIDLFMITIIDTLKDLIQEQQNLYKELAQKNSIDVSDIKIGLND